VLIAEVTWLMTTWLTIAFIAFAFGIFACGLAGRFYPSGKRALVLCLVPLFAFTLEKAFC
jgi:hypothetical protein